ncbi:MFS transporter [Candidatus Poriferisodalis sp.]|uniref:MFS transporter n=1 Tax=Candidatus Poriferisodalis sp. TaxID=3101277 RepID=UPI003B5B6AC8
MRESAAEPHLVADEAAVRPRTVLMVLVGVHAINDFYVTVLPAFLPALADEFGLSYTDLGVLSFAFTLLTGVLSPVLGGEADRRGRRRWILVFGFVIGAVGFLGMAASPSFWLIVMLSLFCGLGGAAYHPQATAFIVSAYPDKRGRMLGIHGWGGSFGHFAAPAAVVLAVSVLNWRLTMVALAIPMVIAAATLQWRLREIPAAPAVRLRGAFNKPLLMLAMSFGAVAMVGMSFINFSVKMLVDKVWDTSDAGVILTVILLVGVVAQPLGGLAFDRAGGRTVLVIAAMGTTLFVGLFALTGGALSLVALGGISFCTFSLFPVSMAMASRLAPPTQTGAGIGVIFGVSGLMTAVAKPAVGILGDITGDIRVALAWLLPLALVAVVLASRLSPDARYVPAAVTK